MWALNLDPNVGTELKSLQNQIANLLRFKAKAALQLCKKFSYELVDKCGKLLVKSLRDLPSTNYVLYITYARVHKTYMPKDIARSFRNYYSALYNLLSPTRLTLISPPLISLASVHQTNLL